MALLSSESMHEKIYKKVAVYPPFFWSCLLNVQVVSNSNNYNRTLGHVHHSREGAMIKTIIVQFMYPIATLKICIFCPRLYINIIIVFILISGH